MESQLPTDPNPDRTTKNAESLAGEDSVDFVRVVHRALRGRYKLAIVLAILVGAIGALEGWRFSGPIYRSEGMVRIASAMPSGIQNPDESRQMPNFDSFIQAQQEVVTSRPVLEAAMKDDIWAAPETPESLRPTIEDLATRLKVETKPRSENMRISFTDTSPAVASSAVTSTIIAFQKAFEHDHRAIEAQRLRLLEEYRDTLTKQLHDAVAVVAPPTTTQPSEMPDATTQPAAAVAEVATTQQLVPPPPVMLTPEQVAMTDGMMRQLLNERTRAQDDRDDAALLYGPNHRIVAKANLAVDRASQRVQKYLADYEAYHMELPPPPQQLKDMATKIAPDRTLDHPQQVAVVVNPLIQQLQTQLDDTLRRIEAAKTATTVQKRFEIVSIGEFPVALQDRRVKTAAAGGMFGASLPFGVIILLGMMRRRYRYCAEVSDDFSTLAPFVAAVPEVDDGNDSRRSADAARCIHHLREALKQTARSYLITSAGAGEGRTNLTMSLALSLCASGSRTLIIDADFTHRGLTKKLKLESAPGLFEGLSRTPGSDLLKTSKLGLSILPAGQTLRGDGASISGVALARLLEYFKSDFDAVLIDAGPVLTGVETSVIASHVDGVILAIARGQKQAAAKDALDKLRRVKARVLGAVFNMADYRDFYRAVRHELPAESQWEPRQVSRLLSEFGPLVRAVALSVHKEIETPSDNSASDGPAIKLPFNTSQAA